MQKILLILLGTLFALPALAYDFQYTYEGKTLTYTVTDVNAKTCKVTQNSITGNLVIPSIAKDGDDEYSVTTIGEAAFADCSGLTSVVIPTSVTSIAYAAFEDCSGLTSVEIPNSVASIGAYAFYGCSGLTSVIIGNLVEPIPNTAFYGCSGLLSIEVSPGNPYYASLDGVLFNKNYSFLIKFPGGRTGDYDIPTSVTSIDQGAFEDSGLNSVTIPNSVIYIGGNAFCGCNSLTSIAVSPENPKYASLDGVLFNKDYSKLIQFPGGKTGEYDIPNSVTSIGWGAFFGCSGLASVTIPNSVTSIGEYAFFGCSGLTSVTIGNSVESIGSCAFDDCGALTSVEIPNSVTSIGIGAFRCCSCLTSVVIGNSVKTIGIQAFGLCNELTSIEVSTENPNYASLDGVLFNKDYSTLIQFPGGKTGEYHIPISVTSIGWGAFNRCLLLTSVNIPNSVTSIDDCAFGWCEALTSVYYLADEPIEGKNNVFTESTYENATLYMSEIGIVKGRTIDPWKNFAKIDVYDPTDGIEAVDADIDFNQPCQVYSLSGAKVGDTTENLAPGIYIVRQGNAVKKIAVKQPTF